MFADATPTGGITDPTFLAWVGIVSLILAVVGVFVSVWLYRKGKPVKLIVYDITSDTPVVSISRQVEREKIKITYQDSEGHNEEITNATLLTLTVQNIGTEDVRIWASDEADITNMEIPIEFVFDARKVVSLTRLTTNPSDDVITQKNLELYLNKPALAPDRLGLPSCILKKGQSIGLAVLLNGPGRDIRVKGKLFNGDIKNLREVNRRRNTLDNILSFLFGTCFILLSILVGIFSALFPHVPSDQNMTISYIIWKDIITVLTLITVILMVWYITTKSIPSIVSHLKNPPWKSNRR